VGVTAATPFPLLDRRRLDANIDRMAKVMADRGVALRPHAKTHKCPEVARRQLAAGAVGLTVATLHEAEVFADAGADDLFIAYPVWAGGSTGARLRALHERVSLRVGVDSVEGAACLGDAMRAAARPLEVAVEIDSGLHRTGVPPSRAATVADCARDNGLDVVGVFTHGGHAYLSADDVATAADDEVRALAQAAEALERAGHDVRVVSAGSTPTASRSSRAPVTEERPGTYVFGDRQQVVLGSCQPDEVALVVAATVVSAPSSDTVVLDAGAKALSSDRRPWMDGFGVLPDYPGALVTRLADEHGMVQLRPGSTGPRIGDVVAVIPNHVCPVVNLSPELIVVEDDTVVARWPVGARR
jgi:D-serine deaminase-like pyridoxal phosphate-dependent protein